MFNLCYFCTYLDSVFMVPLENDSQSVQSQNEKQNQSMAAKSFVGTEMVDGKMVMQIDSCIVYNVIVSLASSPFNICMFSSQGKRGRRTEIV